MKRPTARRRTRTAGKILGYEDLKRIVGGVADPLADLGGLGEKMADCGPEAGGSIRA